MFRTIAIITAAVSVIGLAAAPEQTQAAPQQKAAPKGPPGGGGGPKNFNVNKNFGGNKNIGNPGGNKNVNKNFNVNKNVNVQQNFKVNKNVNVNKNLNLNKNLNVNKNVNFNKNLNVNKNFNVNKNVNFNPNLKKFQPGPGPINKVVFKPQPNMQFVKLGNKVAPAWKSGPKKIWWGNKWKYFVPLTALGVVALGGAYYYPDAYLSVAAPYCSGITPDGCRLNWQRIDFEDGGSDWQCVQFCPRPGLPPPPRTVAFVAPPPMPQGGACEISIYSEPGYGGANATANDEQPNLGEIGWQNQIASVKVAAGTWDFFSDQQFTGETMRLQPGEYPDLGAEWSKRAGSFMCVQP
jgi:hypothetical protein